MLGGDERREGGKGVEALQGGVQGGDSSEARPGTVNLKGHFSGWSRRRPDGNRVKREQEEKNRNKSTDQPWPIPIECELHM